ncbi:MAG: hypothetical protein J6U54_24640 [Clostridiales bacterium]|nr:hypothetical protein [Clostridiales bacterium]
MTELNDRLLNKRICPSCGGNLKHDEKRSLFFCDFCGVEIDYDFLLKNDILVEAYDNLYSEDFPSAKKLFDMVLQKDPSSAAALRGNLFCDLHIKSTGIFKKGIKDVKDTGKVRGSDMMDRLHVTKFDDYINKANGDNKEYFSQIKEFLYKLDEFSKVYDKVHDDEIFSDNYQISRKNNTRKVMSYTIITLVSLCLLVFSLVVLNTGDADDSVSMMIILIEVSVIVAATFGIKLGQTIQTLVKDGKKNKELLDNGEPSKKSNDILSEKVPELNALYDSIIKLDKNIWERKK